MRNALGMVLGRGWGGDCTIDRYWSEEVLEEEEEDRRGFKDHIFSFRGRNRDEVRYQIHLPDEKNLLYRVISFLG